jgi:hypothetical protein
MYLAARRMYYEKFNIICPLKILYHHYHQQFNTATSVLLVYTN